MSGDVNVSKENLEQLDTSCKSTYGIASTGSETKPESSGTRVRPRVSFDLEESPDTPLKDKDCSLSVSDVSFREDDFIDNLDSTNSNSHEQRTRKDAVLPVGKATSSDVQSCYIPEEVQKPVAYADGSNDNTSLSEGNTSVSVTSSEPDVQKLCARVSFDHDERPKDERVSSVNGEDDSTFNLPPDFLQRAPSHITVKKLTSRNTRYNTYPNLQVDFNRAKEELRHQIKNQMSVPVHSDLERSRNETGVLEDVIVKKEAINMASSFEKETDEDYFDAVDSFESFEETSLMDKSFSENEDSIESSVCIECVKPVQVNDRSEIRTGDHIIFAGTTYDHHGIVTEINDMGSDSPPEEACITMVHATNTSAKATLASLHPFSSKARLKRVKETINLKDKKVLIVKYSKKVKPFAPAKVVGRAEAEALADAEGGKGKFKYNVFWSNCEHFASWCVTGKKLSLQVRKFSMVFWMFLKSGFYGISDENLRNDKEYENGMLCEDCYLRNKRLLNVTKTNVTEADQVKAGDIIMYTYYFLWHCAVVLRILKTEDNYVECEIAHYAFCWFKHRTIRKEKLIIPLNGSVMLLTYPKDVFNVYSAEEVVERATLRIDEQMFAFFSNDSSQFSRWCKLKLEKQSAPS